MPNRAGNVQPEVHLQISSIFDDIIKRSLERSASYGVDPYQVSAPESTRLSHEELERRIKKQEAFYSLAVEQLNSLYELLKDTNFCMALADAEGYVLHVVGDPEMVEHFKQRNCLPGYRWTERDMGTCAIGLALHERQPIFLHGSQMYSALVRNVSNAGAPVFTPDRKQLLGVISLTGSSDKTHMHTLGLVRQAAETVTAQIKERERIQELTISNLYLRAIVESDSRGVIIIDQAGVVVEVSNSAYRMLKLSSSCKGLPFEESVGRYGVMHYLQMGKGFRAREILVPRSGNTHFASLDPIRNKSGDCVGGLFTIMEKKEMMRMAVEMTGLQAPFTFDSILGKSPRLKQALHLAHIAADGSAPVLLSGETGTGKELFAQAIHNSSSRRGQPFVAINCGAIPKELLESELFGYEEGAFTGAKKGGRPGKLELADTGTLFLDEIGDMPFDMQVKLLRVLQTKEIQRVGGIRSIPVDIRVISATNKNLKEAISQHKFRSDLFYRISTLNITIPALRERSDDILLLAEHFIHLHELRLNRSALPLLPETSTALQKYSWPGNVRQLENAVERAIYLAEGKTLLPSHFGFEESQSVGNASEKNSTCITLENLERQAIVNALGYFSGNISQTAQALGITRPTLYRKIEKYHLAPTGSMFSE